MPIIVTITKSPELASITESSKTFDEQGGLLGRGKNNDWILSDPERYLSSCHCQISCENGQYYITDLSTNGTFLNGSSNPMGKGSKLSLNHKDTFMLGDYVFSVSINSAAQNAFSDPFASQLASPGAANDIFSAAPSNNVDLNNLNLFSNEAVANSDALFNVDPRAADPLEALNKAHGVPQAKPSGLFKESSKSTSQSDQVDPINQQVKWPNSIVEQNGGGIPDDWDEDLYSSFTPPKRPSAGVKRTKASGAAPPVQPGFKAASGGASDMHLIDAMGLNNKNLNAAEIAQINSVVGEVVREMVGGLMQVLNSRSSIKNEFRMNVTTIQPVENNPLKFSANVDDALENMFIKKGNAYKKPVEAVRESFQGVAEHQVAILAGIRAAFKGIIDRFDPQQLEQRFAKQRKGGHILGNQKAKNWDLYLEYFQRLAGDSDNSFQYLFGDEFVQAYEDQLQQLLIARKTQKKQPEK